MVRSGAKAVVALALMGCLAACRPPAMVAADAEQDVSFAAVKEAPAAEASGEPVKVYTKHDAPGGFEYDQYKGWLQRAEYPSAEKPHLVLGKIVVQQRTKVRWRDLDDKKTLDILWDKVQQAALAEAAKHGANALLSSSRGQWLRGRSQTRKVTFVALRLSDGKPAWPTVDELIGKLKLPQGYREVQRSTHQLEDLPTTEIEIGLKRGHCYLMALAFHPGPIDRTAASRGSKSPLSINFRTALSKPVTIPGYNTIDATAGGFTAHLDYKDGKSWHQLDGVWSRAGAGTVRCPAIKTQRAKLTFYTHTGSATANPPKFEPGKGKAELILFERSLPAAERSKKLCGKCWHAMKQCDPYKRPSCTVLSECLASIDLNYGSCAATYPKPPPRR